MVLCWGTVNSLNYISQGSPEETKPIEGEIYFKKLAYVIAEAGKSELCSADQQS